jgi:hypothetical protein
MELNSDVLRHLIYVYTCQTLDEKKSEATKHKNGIGFNGTDAKILSSIAEYYIRFGRLSQKQIEVVEKRMRKYHRQVPPFDFSLDNICLIE